jgi:hypothetical protein
MIFPKVPFQAIPINVKKSNYGNLFSFYGRALMVGFPGIFTGLIAAL